MYICFFSFYALTNFEIKLAHVILLSQSFSYKTGTVFNLNCIVCTYRMNKHDEIASVCFTNNTLRTRLLYEIRDQLKCMNAMITV